MNIRNFPLIMMILIILFCIGGANLILQFSNDFARDLLSLCSALLVLGTLIVTVYITLQNRMQMRQPRIIMFLQRSPYSSTTLRIVISNEGFGNAYDLSFKSEGVIEGNRKIADLGFLKKGIRYLPPKGTYATDLTTILWANEHNEPVWKIIMEFQDEFHIKKTTEVTLQPDLFQEAPVTHISTY